MSQRILPGQPIPITLSIRDRELIIEHTFAEQNVTDPLEQAIPKDNTLTIHLTLEDLEDLLGSIAAEANHTKNKKLEDELDELYDRLQEMEERYFEEDEPH